MMRRLRPLLAAAALAVVLSACTATFVPGRVGVDVRATIGPQFTVRVADGWAATVPPGLRVEGRSVRADRLRYDLVGTDGFRAVYERLHRDLVADGWRRTEYRARPNRIDAAYRRGGLDLEVEVAHRGRDRVRVTLEIDD